MATISKAGVVDGLIVYDVHVYRIVDALDGTASNNIIINADLKQGSLSNNTNSSNSHAEGEGTDATGDFSHSEGKDTTASGDYSHAEGNSTLASGDYSHAEGNNAESQGNYSHAEGYFTLAKGNHSHASGQYTIAFGDYQTAVGRYNKDNNSDDYFVVGDGPDASNRSDALGVNATRTYISNSFFLPDLTNSTQTHILAFDTASKQVYYAPTASATVNAAPPDKAIQFNSGNLLNGSGNFIYDYTLNSLMHGSNVSALGPYSYVGGSGSVSFNSNFYGFVHGLQCYAAGVDTVVIGRNSTASNAGAIAIGNGLVTNLANSMLVGQYNITASLDPFTIGVGVNNSNRKNGFGINNTRAYISTSLELPTLTNTNTGFVLSYDTSSKVVNYIPNPAVTPPGDPDKAIQFNKNSTFSGSAKFTFDYNINKVLLTGSMLISGSAPTSSLTLIGSGSNYNTFEIFGTQGDLFTVTDISSGSLFSVNDISGLPILDVISDNTVLLGDSNFPAYHTTDYFITTAAGPFKLGAIPTSSYDGGYFECVIKNGVNSRSEYITANWNNSTIVSSSLVTANIGTVGVTLFAALSGSYAILSGSAPAAGWTIKSIIRAI